MKTVTNRQKVEQNKLAVMPTVTRTDEPPIKALAVNQSVQAGLIVTCARERKQKQVESEIARLQELFSEPANQD